MSSNRPLDPAIRTLLLFFGMAALFLGLGYESWIVFAAGPSDEGIEVPPLVATLEAPDEGASLEVDAEPLAGPPRNLEISVRTLAALLPGQGRGPGRLTVFSHIGSQGAAFRLRFVAGPAEGRSLDSSAFKNPSRAEISGLPLGRHLLRIENPATARSTLRALNLRRGDLPRIDIDWARLSDLSGRVFDDEGLPIRGAQVQLGDHRTRSDASGRFQLSGLPAGPGQPLILAAPGHASRFELLSLRPGKIRGLRFPLLPGYSLRGRVHLSPATLRREQKTLRLAL
ncbi:MAG TPA: carboxypeptidase regulatory-like domain-containing protein, partial [Planctomycetes bacterium]|nr:carboxypeptidase regulatory-like domain-containing protein [Planctomycetota bacterium]